MQIPLVGVRKYRIDALEKSFGQELTRVWERYFVWRIWDETKAEYVSERRSNLRPLGLILNFSCRESARRYLRRELEPEKNSYWNNNWDDSESLLEKEAHGH
jgi:hypothetical protein